jgi:hypothetical protein
MRQLIAIFTVVVAFVCFATESSAATDRRFRINDFMVVVDEFQINASRTGSPVANATFNLPKTLDGLTISGKGHTAINGRRIKVAFYKIQLKYDRVLVLPGRGLPVKIPPLVAIKGVVKGTALNPSYIAYRIDSHRIFVKPDTLSISPKQAEATVSVGINTQHFSDTFSKMTIHSPVSFISSTGAVAASNFSNSVRFDLKGSPLQLIIRPEDKYNVNLGEHFPVSALGRHGISIKGKVSKDNVDAFRFAGIISNTNMLVVAATLEQSFHTYPDNYTIHVKQGRIDLSYKVNGERSVGGRFGADIQMPDANLNENNQPLATLTDVKLDLDNRFGLNNSIVIAEKVRIGRHFVFEPEPNGAWAYFPNWPINESYSSYKTKPRNCSQWRDAFSDLLHDSKAGQNLPIHALAKRPGITMVKGVTYFTSPQISTTGDDLKTTVKSRAVAMLTMTFSGPTGPLAGTSASFVSVDSDIAEGDSIATPARKQWQEIIATGENMPEEQGHRFTLADLRILDMKLVKSYFCGNQMDPQSAMFHYTVHFPHPSYINLLFEDKSLGPDGRFSMAKGPVVPFTINFSTDISDAEMANLGSELPKYSYFLPNPDTHILWAWRLPISFSDRGVHIAFNSANNTDTDIAVRMFTAGSPEPEAALTAAQHTAMVNSGEPSGRITSSEMWLKPLYSKDSAIRKGVRFGAAINAVNGAFEVTDIDTAPFLSPIYVAPGDERNVGFYTKLNRLEDGGLKLADAASNPADRHTDFSWSGKIQFPFFSNAAPDSWKSARFDVKDLLPGMAGALSMNHEGMKYTCQNQSSGVCNPSEQPPPSLSVMIEDLEFRPQQTDFFSTNVKTIEMDDDQSNELISRSIEVTSFVNATVQLDFSGVAEPYPVSEEYAPEGECGGAKWTRSILTDYQRSENQVDLVCYDRTALCIRGCGTCSEAYIAGTYEVRTRPCALLDECEETTIFKAPKAKYYPNLKRIDLNRSDAIASTDAGDNPYQTVIDIPSAQIAFSEDGRYIEGAFGATYAQVAVNLPYEGFLNFKLDNKCGYYYLYGGGSFTYALTFRGQSIIINAPYRFLKQPSPFFLVTDTMRALTIRALYSSEEKFEQAAGLDRVGMDTVLSGLITSGNVEFGYSMGIGLTVKAGPGLVLYQYKNPNEEKKYRIGTFLKAIGEAELNMLLMSIGVSGDAELSMQAAVPQTVLTLEDLNDIRDSGEFSLYGSMELKGCGSITCIGSCCGTLTFDASFSNDGGFDADGGEPGGSCEGESCLW